MRSAGEPCRLCMGKSDGIELFPTSSEQCDLVQRISYSVGIKVSSTDTCQSLCQECANKVNALFEFKVMCQRTEKDFGPSYNHTIGNNSVPIKREPEDCSSHIGSNLHEPWSKAPSGMVLMAGGMVLQGAMVPVGNPIPLQNLNMTMPMISLFSSESAPVHTSLGENLSFVEPKQEQLSDCDVVVKTEPEPQPTIDSPKDIGHMESRSPTLADADCSDDNDLALEKVLSQVHTDTDTSEKGYDGNNIKEAQNDLCKEKEVENERTLRGGKRVKVRDIKRKRYTNDLSDETDQDDVEEKPRTYKRKVKRISSDTQLKEREKSKPPIRLSRPRRSCVKNQKPIFLAQDSDESGDDPDDPEFSLNNKGDTSSSYDVDDLNSNSENENSVKDSSEKATKTVSPESQKSTQTDYPKKDSPKEDSSEKSQDKSSSNVTETMRPTYSGTLRCKQCPRIFRSEIYLKCHEKTHLTSERFICVKCNAQFTTRSDLENHEDNNHADETWECKPCFVAFAQIKTWRAHVKRHKTYPRQIHIALSEEEDDPAPIEEKEKDMNKEKGKTGNVQEKEKSKESSPESNKEESESQENDKVMEKDKGKEQDKSSSKSETKLTCLVCHVDIADQQTMMEHMKVHQRVRGPPYKCKFCHKQFKDRGALICHETEHKPTFEKKPRTVKCRFCEKTFVNLSDKICHEEISHRK